MKHALSIALAWLGVAASSSSAGAQALPFDHVHVSVPEVAAAVAWYRRFVGGEVIAGEPDNRLMLGTTRLVFMANAAPSRADGSVIDHIGYTMVDVPAAVARIVANGGTLLARAGELPGATMVADPWGTPFELVPGSATAMHHIHQRTRDPKATIRWYARMFEGLPTRMAATPAISFGDVTIIVSKGDGRSSNGAMYDHLGWRTPVLEATMARLSAGATPLLSGIEKRGATTRVIFVEGPSGTKIELLQR
jgi:catechol 2,3-dioxygenase-like lactoylglutathione lyase family enzyme